jgi:hypothetical protein
MKVPFLITEEQVDAAHAADFRSPKVTIAGQEWEVAYPRVGESGDVFAWFGGNAARLNIYQDGTRKKPGVPYGLVRYGPAYTRFTDTDEIADAGLRGMAVAMIEARHEADRLCILALAAKNQQKAAEREAALDRIDKALT